MAFGALSVNAQFSSTPPNDDAVWMEQALAEAGLAVAAGEVPVGAIVVNSREAEAPPRERESGDHREKYHCVVINPCRKHE